MIVEKEWQGVIKILTLHCAISAALNNPIVNPLDMEDFTEALKKIRSKKRALA